MATKELQALRHNFRVAYTSYMHLVQTLAFASKQGKWPTVDVLAAEEKAFNELGVGRQALLAALFEHSRRA